MKWNTKLKTDYCFFLPPSRRLCDRPTLRLFICLFLSRITQNVTGGCGWNFQGMLDMTQLRVKILVVIGVGIWIHDKTEELFSIGGYWKAPPNRIWFCHLAKASENKIIKPCSMLSTVRGYTRSCSSACVTARMGDLTLGNSGMKWPDINYGQAENGVVIDDFFHVRWKQLCELWSTYEKMILSFDLWPWSSIWL